METVLVVNAGSSSLKAKLLPQRHRFAVERIGGDGSASSDLEVPAHGPITNHEEALRLGLEVLAGALPPERIAAVGHRVVHGGERYTRPTLIDEEVVAAVLDLAVLAPLHNPANVEGIRAAQRLLPGRPQVAVFDTAFHGALPPKAYLFGLPRALYDRGGIRRYGFHGTSHDYVTRQAAGLLGRPRKELRLVSLHLGNGASAAAVREGRSVDTTMGLTPLDGLLMGTRAGEVDPGVLLHLLRQDMPLDDLDDLLNRRSGLLGLSGVSNDMRDVRAAARRGNRAAGEAIAVFAYRVQKVIGAYAAAMGGLDGVVFTGGIGENDPEVRAEAVEQLGFLGLAVDPERNRRNEPVISPPGNPVAVLVVPTDEEAMIADATRAMLVSAGAPGRGKEQAGR